MIKFDGTPTGKCKKYILKCQMKVGLFASAGVAVVFAVPTICTAIYLGVWAWLFYRYRRINGSVKT